MPEYAVYAPEQDELEYFDTYELAEKCAEEWIESYSDSDYGWSDEVHHIRILKVVADSRECNRRTTDEDGEPIDSRFDYYCEYQMVPVEPQTVEDAQARLKRMADAINECLNYFNGRQYEMGERCVAALAILEKALEEDLRAQAAGSEGAATEGEK